MQNKLQKRYNYLFKKREALLDNSCPSYNKEPNPTEEDISEVKKDIKLIKEIDYYQNLTPLERLYFNLRNP